MAEQHQNAIADAFQTTIRPELWVKLTQEDVDNRRAALRKMQRNTLVITWGVLAALALLAVYMFSRVDSTAAGFGVLVAAIICTVTAVVVACQPSRCAIAMSDVVPLKENPYRCRKALTFLEDPNVVAYRDTVVQNGRELLVGDAECMELIFENLDAERICRQVHGLPA